MPRLPIFSGFLLAVLLTALPAGADSVTVADRPSDPTRSNTTRITQIATSTALPDLIMISTEVSWQDQFPPQYSTNAGETWSEVATTPWSPEVLTDIAVAPRTDNTPRLMVFTNNNQLFRTGDWGAVWGMDRLGFDFLYDAAVSPADPTRIYVAQCTSAPWPPGGPWGEVSTSGDSGLTWSGSCGGGGLYSCARKTVPSPVLPNQVYIENSHGWERSDDAGTTCTPLTDFPTHLALDAIDDQRLYGLDPAGTSDDGGETWTPWTDHPSDTGQLLAHPTETQTIFLLADGLFRSRDAGTTWEMLNARSGGFLAPDYSVPGRIFWARDTCLLSSADAGETWRALTPDCMHSHIFLPLVQPPPTH